MAILAVEEQYSDYSSAEVNHRCDRETLDLVDESIREEAKWCGIMFWQRPRLVLAGVGGRVVSLVNPSARINSFQAFAT